MAKAVLDPRAAMGQLGGMKWFAVTLALLPSLSLAHPHIFIDARLELLFDDQGRAIGIRQEWLYDDLFSLLLTEEMQIDDDADGVLTEDERIILRDFVTGWPPGFDGDLVVVRDGQRVALAEPREQDVQMIQGRVLETHLRPFVRPLPVNEAVAIQVYDPGFYTAYDLSAQIVFNGRGDCATRVDKADILAANEMVEQLLGGLAAADIGPEEAFPEVGHVYADTLWVICDVS